MKKIDLELIVLNSEDAIDAEKYGATRLELVRELDKGGLTPMIKTIDEVTNAVKIPVYVMLREKADNFIYSPEEFNLLLSQLEEIKQTKATGIVFGSLDVNLEINREQLQIIIDNKQHLQLTFHRAIDDAISYPKALAIIKEYSEIDFLLSSGGEASAVEGFFNLAKASMLLGDKLLIGSKVNIDNANILLQLKHSTRIHVGTSIREENNILNKISRIKMNDLLNSLE